MMKRGLAVAGFAVALGLGYTFLGTPQGDITVSNGQAIPMGGSGDMFMVTLDLKNDGQPVTLESVSSPTGAQVSIMTPVRERPIVIPGGDTAQLAMDGAHIMLRMPSGEFPAGTFQALSLGLSDGSEVVARILHPETSGAMAMMDHGVAHGIEISPSPAIDLAREPSVDKQGFEVAITVDNFAFIRVDDSAAHVDGQGHAHIYLNGVKLGRLYEERFEVGALGPGAYVLSVVLNANDHRPYVSNGAPVSVTYEFQI